MPEPSHLLFRPGSSCVGTGEASLGRDLGAPLVGCVCHRSLLGRRAAQLFHPPIGTREEDPAEPAHHGLGRHLGNPEPEIIVRLEKPSHRREGRRREVGEAEEGTKCSRGPLTIGPGQHHRHLEGRTHYLVGHVLRFGPLRAQGVGPPSSTGAVSRRSSSTIWTA